MDEHPPVSAWTLERLVSPLTVREMRQLLATRALTRLPALAPHLAASLFSWNRLTRLLAEEPWPLASVQVTRDAHNLPSVFYAAGDHVDASRLLKILEAGGSLVVRRLHLMVPEIRALCSDIRDTLQERINVAFVVTTGAGAALPLHYDTADVLVVQLEGAKRWLVFDDPVPNPVRGMQRDPSQPEGRIAFDAELKAGERLFVPAGLSHRCVNGDGRSLHVAILFEPPCAQNVLQAFAQGLKAQPQFRHPVGRSGDALEVQGEQAAMKAEILERLSSVPAAELIAAFITRNTENKPGW